MGSDCISSWSLLIFLLCSFVFYSAFTKHLLFNNDFLSLFFQYLSRGVLTDLECLFHLIHKVNSISLTKSILLYHCYYVPHRKGGGILFLVRILLASALALAFALASATA